MSTYPIVGAFYRPPAKALLEVLPIGTQLMLMAEPDNAYDPNAIAVWLNTTDIPEASFAKLEELLPNYGTDVDTVKASEAHHVGYIPKEMAKSLRDNEVVKVETIVIASFSLSSSGAPRVRLSDT
jgi:hypothetical protein